MPSECDGKSKFKKIYKSPVYPHIYINLPIDIWILISDFDSCKPNPCNYGVCIDKLDGFECRCQHGFFGQTCEENVDHCLENACENNSTCQDGASNYTCICTEGFKGDLCEIAMGKKLSYKFYFSNIYFAELFYNVIDI